MSRTKDIVDLDTVTRKLVLQNKETKKCQSALTNSKKELFIQNRQKENRAAELKIANRELAYEDREKEKRASELIVANRQLVFENTEKEKRASELITVIDELTESEKRYSNLFHFSPQPRWVYDPLTSKCLQVNKAAIACFGYSEQEFLVMDINSLDTGQKSLKKKKVEKKPCNNTNTFTGRRRYYKKSGVPVEAEIYCNPIFINNITCVSVLAIDITEKILQEYKITRAIIKTQENERYQIGAELHDNVCQILASSLMSFRLLKERLDPAGIQLFNQSQDCITLALEEIRNLSHRLAPAFFEESTMAEAFARLLNEFNADSKFSIILNFDKKVAKERIHMDLQLNLYRILQEQLSNIAKYSKAKLIKVDIRVDKHTLKMQVTDDGVGFNVKEIKDGIGISNMKRRSELFLGKLEIISSEKKGCVLKVEIPLEENEMINMQQR